MLPFLLFVFQTIFFMMAKYIHTYRLMGGWTDGLITRWTDGWTNGQMDIQIDRQLSEY